MDKVVEIIIAVQTNAAWEEFKKNFECDANDIYNAYLAFKDSCDSNSGVFETYLWAWYTEVTHYYK